MKKWLMVLVPVLVIGVLITWRLREKMAENAEQAGRPRMRGAVSAELAMPQERDVVKTFQATGNVEPIQEVKLSTKASGRIESLNVREGDHVTVGQELARLDQSELKAQVRQQEANLAEAKSRLAQAEHNKGPVDANVDTQIRQQQANHANAEAELRQAQRTREAQLEAITATQEDARCKVDSAAAAVTTAESDLAQAHRAREAQLEAITATLDEAESKIETANASVANATALVNSAQANLESAAAKHERAQALFKQGFISAQQVEDANTALRVQQSSVETAKGQLRSANAALASAKAQRRSTEQQTNITRGKVEADVESAGARVKQAKAALASAQAQQRSAEQQANITRVRVEGDVNLADTKLTQAKAALDYARANHKSSSPAYGQNLAALRAGIAAAQASLDNARAKLSDTVLHSPLNGVVTARAQEVGGMASPGQALLTVQSINQVWVTIAVPTEVCRRLQLNQDAKVEFDALDGRVFTGRIAQINPSADAQSRQYTVRVILDNAKKLFTAGMFAKVTLVTERAANVLAVPCEAVHQDRDGSHYVIAVGKDNIAHQRTVAAGIDDDNWTAILDGLSPGERVVTMSASPVRDGQQVQAPGGERRGERRPGGRDGATPRGGGDGDQPRGGRGG